MKIALGHVLLLALAVLPVAARAEPTAPHQAGGAVTETVCSLIDASAQANRVPVGVLTRLIWVESRFRSDALSPKGAQGIAQFMPDTAAVRGLADPFDPEQAIPDAARLLAELAGRFGNIGLAAAAYNAGPNRVAGWLAGAETLPVATQAYVLSLTGMAAEDWQRSGRGISPAGSPDEGHSCAEITAALLTQDETAEAPVAPWGVQLAGNFSKTIALASFARAEQRYRGVIGDSRPMIVGGVLRSRGTRRFFRIMIPEASRADADRACQAILAIGGACVAQRS